MVMFRSTRGASKQRRDLINSEISHLRDLLPLPESARQRLSQLQIMSLTCVYIRKCNYFTRLFGQSSFPAGSNFEFSQAMTGFLLITTREGKMLYISENVTEYLGHSMVDMMTQGDSLYDIIDKRDHAPVQAQLLHSSYTPGSEEERTFFCRMNVARSFRRQAGFGDHKVMHVRGHFMQPVIRDHYGNQPVFMALCSPLITPDVKETVIQNSTMIFQSVHGLDMKYIELATNGEHHLGYSEVEMFGKSWYELLHPDDVHEAKDKHMQLIKSSHEMGCMLTVRLMSKSAEWVWVNMVMHIRQPFICDNGDPAIVCINNVIQEPDAQHFKVQSQLYSSHIARSPEIFSSSHQVSPPHTITQVSIEQEQQQYQIQTYPPIQHPGSDGSGMSYYAEFPVTPAPPAVASGSLGGDPGMTQQTTPPGSISSFSDSSFDTSPTGRTLQEQKEILHADVLKRIKRKMETGQPRQQLQSQQQQCKPAKLPRYSSSSSDGSPSAPSNITYSASLLTGPGMEFGGSLDSSSSGGAQVLLPTVHGKVYEQLALKKEVDVLVPKAEIFMPQCILETPPTPSSPESVSSDGHIPSELTKLTVETRESILVPSSILTPDSSPTTTPTFVFSYASPGSQEQCVPTLLTELSDIFSAELDKEQQDVRTKSNMEKDLKAIKMEVIPTEQQKGLLPELDAMTLERYLQNVEGSAISLMAATSRHIPRVATCTSTSILSTASNDTVSVVPSPYSASSESPVASPGADTDASMDMEDTRPVLAISGMMGSGSCTEDDLLKLNDVQLTALEAAVTDVILGLVQRNTPNGHASPISLPNMDLSGDFMVVPHQRQPSPAAAELPDQPSPVTSTTGVMLSDDVDAQMLSPAETGDLLDELHQLNELASSTPSYGDDDLTSSLFD